MWLVEEKVSGYRVFRYNGNLWETFNLSFSNGIRDWDVDDGGNVWLIARKCRADTECLYRFDTAHRSEYWYTTPFAIEPFQVRMLSISSNGDVWVGGKWSTGVARLQRGKDEWKVYAGKDLWPDGIVNNPGGGFKWDDIQVEAGQNGSIWAFLHSSSPIISIDTEGKITRIPLDVIKTSMQGMAFLIFNESKDGDLWIAVDPHQTSTSGPQLALVHYDGTQWTEFTDLPFDRAIFQFAESSDGTIWMVTASGVYRYNR